MKDNPVMQTSSVSFSLLNVSFEGFQNSSELIINTGHKRPSFRRLGGHNSTLTKGHQIGEKNSRLMKIFLF